MNLPIIAAVDPATATPVAKPLLDAVKIKLGVVPNMMRTMANNPAVLRAYLDFMGALSSGSLGGKLHTKIALAVAQANGCNYCLAAHTFLGKQAGLSTDDMMKARKPTAADAREAAALKFASGLVTRRGAATVTDVKMARDAGLSDADILEVVGVVALNIFTNYINITAGTEIDFPAAGQLTEAA